MKYSCMDCGLFIAIKTRKIRCIDCKKNRETFLRQPKSKEHGDMRKLAKLAHWKVYKEKNKTEIKVKDAVKKENSIRNLSDHYIASKLGMKTKDCGQLLIKMKREHILFGRELKLLRKTIEEIENGN